jgi:hypothetical protein
MSQARTSHLSSSILRALAHPAVEITVRWGGTVVHVTRVAAPRRFILGDGGPTVRCDYALPENKLGDTQHELVRFEYGRPVVFVPEAAAPTPTAAPGTRVVLAPNQALEIKLGDITLVVRAAAIARPVPRSILHALDRRLIGYWIGAAAASLLLVGAWGMPRFTFGLHGEEWSRVPGYELGAYDVGGPVSADAHSEFGRMPVRAVWR